MQRRMLRLSVLVLVALLLGSGLSFAAEKPMLVNINTADEATLVTLDQIGRARAQAIIEYREANGAFRSVDDLKAVNGIGSKIFEAIKSKVTVGQS
jgi:competence protein ComEA